MKTPPALVTFDDGTEIVVQGRSRDLLAIERSGVDVANVAPMEMGYRSVYAALERMKRNGELPEGFELPASVEEFMDGADIDEQPDEGEGSGQAATTG